ncbi:hypothetical protein ATI61_106180 [Archangium gephyra]|uniref:Uncharacterized protein n=1 Tax=Archangium gephyra TaxID=48 RepID=A0ABX9K087_9BACT|nr:hypothetical protein ATI61_106180 [Archangium gephyra]
MSVWASRVPRGTPCPGWVGGPGALLAAEQSPWGVPRGTWDPAEAGGVGVLAGTLDGDGRLSGRSCSTWNERVRRLSWVLGEPGSGGARMRPLGPEGVPRGTGHPGAGMGKRRRRSCWRLKTLHRRCSTWNGGSGSRGDGGGEVDRSPRPDERLSGRGMFHVERAPPETRWVSCLPQPGWRREEPSWGVPRGTWNGPGLGGAGAPWSEPRARVSGSWAEARERFLPTPGSRATSAGWTGAVLAPWLVAARGAALQAGRVPRGTSGPAHVPHPSPLPGGEGLPTEPTRGPDTLTLSLSRGERGDWGEIGRRWGWGGGGEPAAGGCQAGELEV